MENEQHKEDSSSMIAYIVGAVLVIAIVGGAWYFRSQSAEVTPTTDETMENTQENVVTNTAPLLPSPTPGPITGLGCDQQYFNPKNGFAEYYLSAEGGDLAPATNVVCDFTAKVGTRVVANTTASSPLVDNVSRGGKTFRCSTKAVELTPNVPTTIEVLLRDDANHTASCSAEFTYPAP